MEIYTITVKNKILLFQDLTDNDVKNFIGEHSVKGKIRKYPFGVLYSIMSPNNYLDKSLSEIYDYALINFKTFFNNFEHEYSEEDIQNFALLFALNNYHFTSENIQEHVQFLEDKFVEHESDVEIINWCQDSIKKFKVYIYSYDLENYRNGTITKLLEDLDGVPNNYSADVIYEIIDNPIDE